MRRGVVGQHQGSAIRAFIHAIGGTRGIDTYVVASDPRHESSLRCHSPAFDVRFKKIHVVTDECGRSLSPWSSKNSAAHIRAATWTARSRANNASLPPSGLAG